MYISSTVINAIYSEATLSSRELSQNCNSITVPGLIGKSHTFNRRRLEDKYTYIMSAMKKVPEKFLRSKNKNGAPWIFARHRNSGETWEIDCIERMLAMAVALDIARIIQVSGGATNIPHIVVDDDRFIRLERMKPRESRRRLLSEWKAK